MLLRNLTLAQPARPMASLAPHRALAGRPRPGNSAFRALRDHFNLKGIFRPFQRNAEFRVPRSALNFELKGIFRPFWRNAEFRVPRSP